MTLPEQTQIIAHRGASHDEPENTLVAFRRAIEMGADQIEFDVRRSADGVLYIHHDPNIGTANLKKLTWAEIQRQPGGEAIPTLKAVLDVVAGKIGLDVEIKEPGIEDDVVGMLETNLSLDGFMITSLADTVVARVKELNAAIVAGLLLGKRAWRQSLAGQGTDPFSKRLRQTKADFVACNYLFGEDVVRRAARVVGVPMAIWVVNEPELIRRYLQDEDVFAIITSRPDVALHIRNGVDILG